MVEKVQPVVGFTTDNVYVPAPVPLVFCKVGDETLPPAGGLHK